MRDYNQAELEKLEERLKKLATPIEPKTEETSTKDCQEKPDEKNLKPYETAKKPTNPTEDLMKKFLQDAELEYKKSQFKNDSDEEEKEKVCCICDIDATIKCIDCDNDYYCKKCFK